MRRTVVSLAFLLIPSLLAAQRRDSSTHDAVPEGIRSILMARWNGAAAVRAWDSVTVGERAPVPGNVAVQNGPVVVAGRVAGSVLAVNSDVILRPGSRVEGDLWVVGGRVTGRGDATVDGEVRIYEQRVSARRDGDRIEIDEDVYEPRGLRRPPRVGYRSWSNPIHVSSAGAYNRVEGLPVNIGPSIQQITSWGRLRIDAYAVVRTGSTFESEGGDVGHDVSAELRFGHVRGPSFGGRLFNTIGAVEDWQLTEIETSLAAFLFRRDYRDYYANRGVSGFARFYAGSDATVTGTFSDVRWDARNHLNPFTLFRGDASWRPNPLMDAGRLHLTNLSMTYDTRTDPDAPGSGFYVLLDAEHGTGTLTTLAPTSVARNYSAGDRISYNRGFLDARSYNRLSPSAQISLRVVAGGSISGDAMPLQRRLSVEGPSALPGYDFRDFTQNFDTGTCSVGSPVGRPAECDRIALFQVEYRGNLHLDIGDWREDAGRYIGARSEASWVMFFDAGRGWMVGPPSGEAVYDSDELPSINTFRSDVGLGFDFGGIGIYAAKALSMPSEPVNFFLRLHRRF